MIKSKGVQSEFGIVGKTNALQYRLEKTNSEDNDYDGYVCIRCGCDEIIKIWNNKRGRNFAYCARCKSSGLILACVECGSNHIVEDDVRAEIVCRTCGLVLARPFYSVGNHSYQIIQKKIKN